MIRPITGEPVPLQRGDVTLRVTLRPTARPIRRAAPHFGAVDVGTERATVGGMNASKTMTRTASELDVGSRVVYDGEIKTVAAIADLFDAPFRPVVTMRFTDDTSTMEPAGAMFVCLAAE